MSIAAKIRDIYDKGLITDSPEDKKIVAVKFGIAVQTVHATIKKHLAKKGITVIKPAKIGSGVQVIKFTDNYSGVRKTINERFKECYEIAAAAGYVLREIDIDWSLKGTVAGMYCRKAGRKYFRVNLLLAEANIEDYLSDTIPHEFCHYIVDYELLKGSFGRHPKPHGTEWKMMMIRVFNLQPKRCHDYDTSQVKRKVVRPYVYKCGCREFPQTRTIHNRMKYQGQRRRCRTCGGLLTFSHMA